MNRSLRLVAAAAALLAACSTSAQDPETPGKRPNILLAIADDWGWPHAGAYGDPVVATPTFDRVAREGVLFERAFVSSPSCTPSRAALLTGQWHWRLEESANLWSTLRARFPVYPDLLEAAGYHVGFTRKGWGPGRVEPGGRTRNPAGARYDDFDAFLEKRPAGAPFCFWFGSHDPHRGYAPGSGRESGIDLSKIRLPACFPDAEEVRSDVADYYFEVQRFDREVGELLRRIEELGELDDTIVVVTGDHGMPFPRCKSNLYDSGTRVPLAVRWGARVAAGRRVADFVSLTDLAPTFLEAAGLVTPAVMTGASLLSIVTSERDGRVEPGRDRVLFGKERHVPAQEHPESGGYPCRALRTEDYLYVRNFLPERWPAGTPVATRAFVGDWALADCDDGPTKSYIVAHRDEPAVAPLYAAAFGRRPAEELYDLREDPDQLHDVAQDPAYDSVLEQLSTRLETALEASGDPRALGEGARFDRFPYYGRLRPRAPRGPDYDAHVAALELELPSDDFRIVVQPPFVVVGDEGPQAVRSHAEHTVKWAVDLLKDGYFENDPEHIIDIWLFKDEDSYETNTRKLFNERPTTPFGYYSSRHRALIMNIHTGGGTLVHEIVHPFMAANFAACPAWFNEGLASLYEQCGEADGHIVGHTNWRLPVLKRAFEDRTVTTFEELTGTTTGEFYGRGQGVRYAQARYLCYYLQEKGLLRRFYREFRAGVAKDPTGYATLKKVLGREDMDEFEKEWRRFVLALRYP